MNQSEVCIPWKEREPNKVDVLNLQIERIRKNCKHDFRLIEKPKLQSILNGIIVGELRGPTEVGYSELEMTLVCLQCSEEKKTTILETCPRCLGKMKKEPYCLGAGSRERYFGCSYLYYSVRHSRCQDCGLTVASDEWDQ